MGHDERSGGEQAARARLCLSEAQGDLAAARAALADALRPEACERLIDRYTGTLFDAVRTWQMPLWGPDYIDPVDGPPPALARLLPEAVTQVGDPAAVDSALREIARREYPAAE